MHRVWKVDGKFLNKLQYQRYLASQAQRLAEGKVIPHVTQKEEYDYTYRGQKGQRVPSSYKDPWDFTR